MTQTVLITGSNRGIGFALVQHYAAKGDQVIATCPRLEGAKALQEMAAQNPAIEVHRLDVTDQAAMAALAEKLKDRTIDILINNAGIASGKPDIDTGVLLDQSQIFGTVESAPWEKVLRVNTIGPVLVTQAFYPHMMKSETRKVAMISSRMGSLTDNVDSNYIAYSSSKAALNAAMKSIALHLQSERFIVASINPGWVKTDMGGDQANLTPEESAQRVARVIDTLSHGQNGTFINHTGEIVAW